MRDLMSLSFFLPLVLVYNCIFTLAWCDGSGTKFSSTKILYRKHWPQTFFLDMLCAELMHIYLQPDPFHNNRELLYLPRCCFRVNLRHHIKSSRCLSVLWVKVIPGNCLLNNSSVYCTSLLFVVIKVRRLCTICTTLVGSLSKALCSRAIWSSTEIIFCLPQLKKKISSNLRLESKALCNLRSMTLFNTLVR